MTPAQIVMIVEITKGLVSTAIDLLAIAKNGGADVDALLAEYNALHAKVEAYQALQEPGG